MCADTPETADPKYPVFLPETEFPMRAGLPQREPGWLKRWNEMRNDHSTGTRVKRAKVIRLGSKNR